MNKSSLFAVFIFLFLQKAFPQAYFSIEGNLCQNNILNFIDQSIIEVTAWEWDFGDGTTSIDEKPTHSYNEIGDFSVVLTITSNNGTNFNSTKNILISANPVVIFTSDSTQFSSSTYTRVFLSESTSNNTINTFIWNYGDGSSLASTNSPNIVYKYSDKGTYEVWLKVIDNMGCVDSSSNTIAIHDRFYIPNVFTPNDDKENDEFIVTSNGETLFSIEIYSRWGNLVFKRSGHQQIFWDGTMPDGSLVKPGTYYYVINSESGNVKYEPEKGFITVFY
jgi:gliding motility-associated-like protein